MTLLVLPLPEDTDPVAITANVDGAEYVLGFQPDDVTGYWILNLDVDGVAAIRGAPLVYGTDLLSNSAVRGQLTLLPTDPNEPGVPDIDGLVSKSYLVFHRGVTDG